MRITLVILVVWIILVQSCMRFRVSDEEAINGVVLHSNTVTVNSHHLHYVYCGIDTLPVLVFIHGSPGSWNAFENYLKDSELLKHYQMIAIRTVPTGMLRIEAISWCEEFLLKETETHLLFHLR